MADSNQGQEMARAADRFTEAAYELASALNRFLDFQQSFERRREYSAWQIDPWTPRWGTLSEEESVALALRAVQEVREEKTRNVDWKREERLPQPTPEEVRKRRGGTTQTRSRRGTFLAWCVAPAADRS